MEAREAAPGTVLAIPLGNGQWGAVVVVGRMWETPPPGILPYGTRGSAGPVLGLLNVFAPAPATAAALARSKPAAFRHRIGGFPMRSELLCLVGALPEGSVPVGNVVPAVRMPGASRHPAYFYGADAATVVRSIRAALGPRPPKPEPLPASEWSAGLVDDDGVVVIATSAAWRSARERGETWSHPEALLAGVRARTLVAFATHTEGKVKLVGTTGAPTPAFQRLGVLCVGEDGVWAIPMSTCSAAFGAGALPAKAPKALGVRWPVAPGTCEVYARHAGKLSFEIRFAPASGAGVPELDELPDFDVG